MLRDAEARAAAVAASAKEGEVGASDHESMELFATSKEARALKARQSDVDAQLAEVRAQPLVLAEDEDSEGVKASDVEIGRGI